MFDLIFIDQETDEVKWAVQTRLVNYITMSEVGYITLEGRKTSCAFPQTERLEIIRR